LDELEGRKKIQRARGYGPNYISLFISDQKKKIEKYARDMVIPTPFNVWEKSGGCRDRRSGRRIGQGRLRRRRREHR
jgi:hypothetical protein